MNAAEPVSHVSARHIFDRGFSLSSTYRLLCRPCSRPICPPPVLVSHPFAGVPSHGYPMKTPSPMCNCCLDKPRDDEKREVLRITDLVAEGIAENHAQPKSNPKRESTAEWPASPRAIQLRCFLSQTTATMSGEIDAVYIYDELKYGFCQPAIGFY
jgi:hypothetical protein